MLKHTTISQITFKEKYSIALVETIDAYVVVLGYQGHNKSWGQGIYFPKAKDDIEAIKSASDEYLERVSQEIGFWI